MARVRFVEIVEEGIPHLINVDAIDFIEGLSDGEVLIHLRDGDTSFQASIDFPDLVDQLTNDA